MKYKNNYKEICEKIKKGLSFPKDIKETLIESSSGQAIYLGNIENDKWGLKPYDIIIEIKPYGNKESDMITASLKIKKDEWIDSYGSINHVLKELNKRVTKNFPSES